MKAGTRCLWVLDRGYHKGTCCSNTAVGVVADKIPCCAVHLGLAQDPARLVKQNEPYTRQLRRASK